MSLERCPDHDPRWYSMMFPPGVEFDAEELIALEEDAIQLPGIGQAVAHEERLCVRVDEMMHETEFNVWSLVADHHLQKSAVSVS